MHHAQWQQRWQQWQIMRPKLHRDGIALPASLLLHTLRKQLDSPRLHVVDLTLESGESLLVLDILQPVHTRLQLYFTFAEPDWPARRLCINYRLQGHTEERNLIRRTIGTLLLATLDAGLGLKLLQKLSADYDFIDVTPLQLHLHLDRLPLLHQWLNKPILGQPLANRLAIKSIYTECNALRLCIGRTNRG